MTVFGVYYSLIYKELSVFTRHFLFSESASIESKDKTGEGKINLSEVEKTDETSSHFFIKISSGFSLIIPKRELSNIEILKAKFSEIGLKINDETNWKWK